MINKGDILTSNSWGAAIYYYSEDTYRIDRFMYFIVFISFFNIDIIIHLLLFYTLLEMMGKVELKRFQVKVNPKMLLLLEHHCNQIQLVD